MIYDDDGTKDLIVRPLLGGSTNFAPEGLTQTTSRAGGTDVDYNCFVIDNLQ